MPLAVVLAAVLWYWHPWQPPIIIHERVNPKDGAVMVWVPAGTFRMGTSTGDMLRDAIGRRDWKGVSTVLLHREAHSADETPTHTVFLDGYWIYKYEVTNKQYYTFCRATKRKMPEAAIGSADHPIVNVTWHDAAAYAAWAGAALPTEAQWEKAARGTDGRLYPWGNQWDSERCVNVESAESTKPVGSIPAGASPYGCQDMAGNVGEWCADWYDENYYQHSPAKNPAGPKMGTMHVVRGSNWYSGKSYWFRVVFRQNGDPTGEQDVYGFRCVVRSPGP